MPSSHPTVTDDVLRAALDTVIDPEIRKPITELGMVETASVDESGHVNATILLTVAGCPMKQTLTQDTEKALANIDGVTGVTVTLGVMSDSQRADLRAQLRGGVAEREIPFTKPNNLTRIYAIASGKGASASPRSPPTSRPRSMSRASRSVSSTRTSTASPSRACSAWSTNPRRSTT